MLIWENQIFSILGTLNIFAVMQFLVLNQFPGFYDK